MITMTTRRARRVKLAAGVLAGTLVLVACGDGASADSDGGETNAARIEGEVQAPVAVDEIAIRPESDIPTNLLPDLVVDNLTSDVKVNLRNIVPNDLPILLWMWAPWWTICRREAPDVEQFARENADKVKVIGLGTQDNLGLANDFADNYELTFDVLWDESNYSWQTIGVTSQPTVVMIEGDGTPITGWVGSIPEDEVLRIAAELNGWRVGRSRRSTLEARSLAAAHNGFTVS
jgi:thiol-disulfide isomerase/thioredoxin